MNIGRDLLRDYEYENKDRPTAVSSSQSFAQPYAGLTPEGSSTEVSRSEMSLLGNGMTSWPSYLIPGGAALRPATAAQIPGAPRLAAAPGQPQPAAVAAAGALGQRLPAGYQMYWPGAAGAIPGYPTAILNGIPTSAAGLAGVQPGAVRYPAGMTPMVQMPSPGFHMCPEGSGRSCAVCANFWQTLMTSQSIQAATAARPQSVMAGAGGSAAAFLAASYGQQAAVIGSPWPVAAAADPYRNKLKLPVHSAPRIDRFSPYARQPAAAYPGVPMIPQLYAQNPAAAAHWQFMLQSPYAANLNGLQYGAATQPAVSKDWAGVYQQPTNGEDKSAQDETSSQNSSNGEGQEQSQQQIQSQQGQKDSEEQNNQSDSEDPTYCHCPTQTQPKMGLVSHPPAGVQLTAAPLPAGPPPGALLMPHGAMPKKYPPPPPVLTNPLGLPAGAVIANPGLRPPLDLTC